MLIAHILGGLLAIATGYVALFARKGAPRHRQAGLAFVYAMLLMGATATALAIAVGRESQVSAGVVIAYFVITALVTVREPSATMRIVSIVLMSIALGLGLTGVALTAHALLIGVRVVDGAPVAAGLLRIILVLAALGDLRVLHTTPLHGAKRLYRHLWRMCYAFFIASGSFFLGQADEIPAAIRFWPALIVLAVAPLAAIAYWAWRLRPRAHDRALRRMTFKGDTTHENRLRGSSGVNNAPAREQQPTNSRHQLISRRAGSV
jgi:hypothetical protein